MVIFMSELINIKPSTLCNELNSGKVSFTHLFILIFQLPVFLSLFQCIHKILLKKDFCPINEERGHGGRVVTLSPPTSEAGVRSLSGPYVGKLVVACRWLAVYSTEP